MIGTLATYTNKCPWPGGANVFFDQENVRAVGQLINYNDFVTRYMVRLTDGRECFVTISNQSEIDQKWIRSITRKINKVTSKSAIDGTLAVPSRDLPAIFRWFDLNGEALAT